MKNYRIGIKIYNVFDIEAGTEEEAEEKVRELDCYATLKDCDFNITYVEENNDGVKATEIATDLIAGMREVDSTKMSAFVESNEGERRSYIHAGKSCFESLLSDGDKLQLSIDRVREDMEKLKNAYYALDERIVSLEVENHNMRDHLESLGELDKLVEDGSVSEDKKSKPEAK